jgi:hypothetical protein
MQSHRSNTDGSFIPWYYLLLTSKFYGYPCVPFLSITWHPRVPNHPCLFPASSLLPFIANHWFLIPFLKFPHRNFQNPYSCPFPPEPQQTWLNEFFSTYQQPHKAHLLISNYVSQFSPRSSSISLQNSIRLTGFPISKPNKTLEYNMTWLVHISNKNWSNTFDQQ